MSPSSFTPSGSLSSSTTFNSDQDIVRWANEFIKEEQLLRAARLLRVVQDPSVLSESHRKLLCNAEIIEYVEIYVRWLHIPLGSRSADHSNLKRLLRSYQRPWLPFFPFPLGGPWVVFYHRLIRIG